MSWCVAASGMECTSEDVQWRLCGVDERGAREI